MREGDGVGAVGGQSGVGGRGRAERAAAGGVDIAKLAALGRRERGRRRIVPFTAIVVRLLRPAVLQPILLQASLRFIL